MRLWKGTLAALVFGLGLLSAPLHASDEGLLYFGIHYQMNGPFGERLLAYMPNGFYAVMDSAILYWCYALVCGYLEVPAAQMENTNWIGSQSRNILNLRIGPTFTFNNISLLVGANFDIMGTILPLSETNRTRGVGVWGLPLGIEGGLGVNLGPVNVLALATAQVYFSLQSEFNRSGGYDMIAKRYGIDVYISWVAADAFVVYGSIGWGFISVPSGYYTTNTPAFDLNAPLFTLGVAF